MYIKKDYKTNAKFPDLMGILENSTNVLVAGSTGAGKSTLAYAMIHDVLTSEEAEMILIDPKKREYFGFSETGCCIGYASGVEEAAEMVEYVENLVDSRNENVSPWGKCNETNVYVFIDEFYVISEANKKIVSQISRICAKCRSANVHVIVLTQSPSKKVLPAEFVNNFDCRMGLRCFDSEQPKQIFGVRKKLPDIADLCTLPRKGQREMVIFSDGEYKKFLVPYYEKSYLEEITNIYKKEEAPEEPAEPEIQVTERKLLYTPRQFTAYQPKNIFETSKPEESAKAEIQAVQTVVIPEIVTNEKMATPTPSEIVEATPTISTLFANLIITVLVCFSKLFEKIIDLLYGVSHDSGIAFAEMLTHDTNTKLQKFAIHMSRLLVFLLLYFHIIALYIIRAPFVVIASLVKTIHRYRKPIFWVGWCTAILLPCIFR